MGVIRVGDEFRVNSATAGNQDGQQITTLSNGGFVVVWRDGSVGVGGTGGDATGNAVKAQVFTAAGATVGIEILVNSATASDQDTPQVAALSDGGFVTVWRDRSQGDGGATGDSSSYAVKAKVFNALGEAIGNDATGHEALVNSATTGAQDNAQVAALSNGGFVVAWQDLSAGVGGTTGDLSLGAIKAQVFTALGARTGIELLVNSATASMQITPKITTLSNGGFVIAWQDGSQGVGGATGDGSSYAIKAKVFNALGEAIGHDATGHEFLVNSATESNQTVPQITALSDGGFVVVWQDASHGVDGAEGDTDGYATKARVFKATGEQNGDEILVNSATAGDQAAAQITALSNGGFVVTWQDYSQGVGGATEDGSSYAVKAKVFNALGEAIGHDATEHEILVNSATAQDQAAPQIAALSDGGFVIAWQDGSHGVDGAEGDTTDYAVKAQAFTAEGTPIGGEVRVNTVTAGLQWMPKLTALPDNGFVITWQDASGAVGDTSGYALKAQVFDVILGPALAGAGGTSAFTEGANAASTPVAVAGGLTVSSDGATLASATVSISAHFQSGEDTLSFAETLGTGDIHGEYNPQIGVLTLTSESGEATLAEWQAALRAVTYANSSETPETTSRTISFTINNGTVNSSAVTQTVSVAASNDAPTVGGLSGPLSFTEGGDPVQVASAVTVADVDSAILHSASVSITSGLAASDTLTLADADGVGDIQGSYSSNTGVLTLTSQGGATAAQFQAAIRAVTYSNGSDTPDTTSRTISVVVNDGAANSTAATVGVNITAVNNAPSGADKTISATEDEGRHLAVADFGFQDSDGGSLASVVITTLPTAGTLTLNGVAVSAGQAVSATDIAADKLVFTPAADANGAGYATLTFQVRDGGGTANGGVDTDASANTLTFDVAAVNDPTVLGGVSGTVTFVEGGEPIQVASAVTVADVDSATLRSARVSILGQLSASDTLAFANAEGMGDIDGSYNANTGILTLTSEDGATAAQFQTAIRSVTYSNGSATPETGTRAVSITVNDGGATSVPATVSLDITAVNNAPSGADKTLSATEDQGYHLAVADFGFQDSDGGALASVVVTTLPTAGTLTLDGAAVSAGQTVSAADIAAHKLVFTPAANANGEGYATLTFQVRDDGGSANGGIDTDATAKTLTFDVAATNDPTVLGGGGSAAFTLGGGAISVAPGLTLTDPDGDDTNRTATVTITGGFHPGEDKLALVVTPEMGSISVSFDANTGVLSVSTSEDGASASQLQAALRAVTYVNLSPSADLSERTVTIKASDGFGFSNAVTSTVALSLAPEPEPDPTPAEGLVDGVPVSVTPGTGGDGAPTQTVTIPIVEPGRTDTVGGNTLADIPLVTGGVGDPPLLSAQVPAGFGLTVSGPSAPQTAANSLDDLIQQIQAHTTSGSQDQTILTGGGSNFLSILPPTAPLLVQTIAPIGGVPNIPLVINGLIQTISSIITAVVLDMRAMFENVILQINHINFAAVIGPGVINSDDGVQTIVGDGASQTLSLGGGDDLVQGGRGGDVIDGGSGQDTAEYSGERSDYAVGATRDGWVLDDARGVSSLVSEGAHAAAATAASSADLIKNVETLKFGDRQISLPDHIVAVQVGSVLREGPLEGSGGAAAASLTSQLPTLGSEGVVQALVQMADSTSSVATLSYQFFTGRTPTAAGMDYLVSSDGPNPDSLNSAYYQSFSLENRYINFAVNLGKLGEGAAGFQANYGSLSLFDAARAAYTTIFGAAPSDAKLHAILDTTFTVAGATFTRADYFAALGQDGANGIGTKAAMVGWLLAEAAKADVGTYALANNALLTDVALNDAPLGVGLIGTYDKPEFVLQPG
jgi:hypothetical protein